MAFPRFSLEVDKHSPVVGPEPGFDVECKYHLESGPDVALVHVLPKVTVTLNGRQVGRSRVEVLDVGYLEATGGLEPMHIPITYRVALPFGLVERIQQERLKSGHDNAVGFRLTAKLAVAPIYQGENSLRLSGVPIQVYSETQLAEFSRDEWLKLIEDLGFTRTVVIELPVVPGTHASVQASLAHLQAARRKFADGALDDVGATAFKAFEALVPNRGNQRVFEAIRSEFFGGADPDIAEAAEAMLIKLAKLYHVGGRHHTGVPVAGHHARFLLGAAEMVVAWCAELAR